MRWSDLVATVALAFALTPLLPGETAARRAGLMVPCPDSVSSIPFDPHSAATPFHRMQVGERGTLRFRDIEFFWDSLYVTQRADVGIRNAYGTMDRLGFNLCDDQTGVGNPLGISVSDLRLVHDYLQTRPGVHYDTDPFTDYGFQIGSRSAGDVITEHGVVSSADTIEAKDRGHADFYVYVREDSSRFNYDYGQWPSLFWTAKEDSSTGHFVTDSLTGATTFEVFHRNSFMSPGPRLSANASTIIDTLGTGWVRQDGQAVWVFEHEFQHSLMNPRPQSHAIDEMFSSAAEAIAGNDDKSATDECPSTWNLFELSSRQVGSANVDEWNYQGWRAFTEYLAFLFPGSNQAATMAGLQDDLLFRWSHSTRLWEAFDSLLDEAVRTDCADYFGPDTSSNLRQMLLLHSWRVAQFVNNPSLAQGQYGYPASANFIPGVDLRAWQSVDPFPCNDSLSIPPELIASRRWVQRDTTIVGHRAPMGPPCGPISMTVPMFGAQYWVIRSDASLAQGVQDLRVRISPEELCNFQYAYGDPVYDGRLVATVVPYTEQALPGGAPDSLWKHPEWASAPLPIQWTDIDSAAAALEFTVQGFGTTCKAALVVITLADGPSQTFTVDPSGLKFSTSRLGDPVNRPRHYRLSLAVRESETDTSDVRMAARVAGQADDHATWAPTGEALAFESTDLSVSSQQQIYTVPAVGGTPTRLRPAALRQSSPDWSPRGDWVAFESESTDALSSIWIADGLGHAYRLTPQDRQRRSPVFRPDGQRLVYAAFPGVVGGQVHDLWQLRRINADGTDDVALTPPLTEVEPMTLRWSPDGTRIYFTRNDSILSVGAMGGLPAYETNLVKRTPSFDLHPSGWRTAYEDTGAYQAQRRRLIWYPDSSGSYEVRDSLRIAYHRLAVHDPARFVLDNVLVPDDEGYFYRASAEYFNPRWSPDGLRIAYSSDQNATGDRDIFIGRVSYNHAPQFDPTPGDTNLVAGTPCTITLHAADADGQALTFLALYLPSGASFSGNTFSWPTPLLGVHHVVFRVTDGTGGVHSRVVRLTVAENASGGGCPFIDTKTASGWVTENSVLARATDGVPRLDAYRLKYTPQARDNRVTLRLRENEQEYTALDQVRLVAVDHAPGVRAFAAGEQVWLGTRVPAVKVVDQHGKDVTTLVDGEGTDFYQGEPGDTLHVSLTGGTMAGATGAQQVLEGGAGIIDDGDKDGEGGGGGGVASGPAPLDAEAALEAHDAAVLAGTGILIQAPDGGGDWRTVEHRYPRASFDEHVLDSLGTGEMRLVFIGRHQVRFIGRLSGAESVTPRVLPLRSASHSRLGDALTAVSAAAGTGTALTPGDTLTLQFEVPAVPEGQVRDLFVLGLGTYSTSRAALRGLPPEEPVALPVAYALAQNQPNPFRGSTTIRFALPQASDVRLEVFDLQGRRVATLAQGRWEAGYHAVEWSQRSERGRRVEPGVYLYRLTAGTFHDQRKLVLLP